MKYGKVEIRAKAPSGKGLWPAIWLLPEKPHAHGWSHPGSGEIDIYEGNGLHPTEIYSTAHFGETLESVGTGALDVGFDTSALSCKIFKKLKFSRMHKI